MERHIQVFLNKLSYASITIATITLFSLYLKTPDTCLPTTTTDRHQNHLPFPKSTCDYTHRSTTSLSKHNSRLWSSKTWSNTVLSYTNLFRSLPNTSVSKSSRALIVSAGPGQAVMALTNMGLSDVTGVELVDSPPLVSRADPHNLPFFDNVFDFGFSPYLDRALFPSRYVAEMERTVRVGGFCVVAVEECGETDVKEVVQLFRKSQFVDAKMSHWLGKMLLGL